MITKKTLKDFRQTGQDLFLRGLISSHAGNLSHRSGERDVIITRRGSMLGHLTMDDLIEVPLSGDHPRIMRASSELVVHRIIYARCTAGAIVHAHPPYATLLSLLDKEIIPVDSEGKHLLQKVGVVEAAQSIGSEEAGELMSDLLRNSNVVLLRGHGSFATGKTLEEAFMYTTSLEASAFLTFHMGHGRRGH